MSSRRHFLAQAASLVLAGTAAAEQTSVLSIVDTHQHLWDLRRFRLPWLQGSGKLNRSFLMMDYLRAAAEVEAHSGTPRARIVKTVYMEVDVAPDQHQAEAEFVLEICRQGRTPMAAAVIGGRPASEGFARYVRPFANSRYIKGVRQVLHGEGTPGGYCLDPRFVAGIRLLGELGLCFDLCMRGTDLPDGVNLVEKCPHTRFILDHCGNPGVQTRDLSPWRRSMTRLAGHKNVVSKVSGIIASARPGKWTADDLAPIVNHTLDSFGPDRVLFAGDWPVCTTVATLAEWVGALRSIVSNRPAAEQRKLFHDNAVRFYGLS